MGDQNSTQTPEEVANELQLLGLLPGPQKPFVTFLTANGGLVTSFGDLIQKIHNGTVTRNDYINVVKDMAAVAAGVSMFSLLVGVTILTSSEILLMGTAFALLDYADAHNYNYDTIYDDLTSKFNKTLEYFNDKIRDSYDTYYAGNGDTIEDSDGNGRVFYNNSLLTGGEWNPEKQVYEGNGGTYEKTANGYKFTTPNGETLNLNIPNGSLGLNFTGAPGDDPLPDAPEATSTNGNPNENFSSPLVLDLNHDNTLSTSLYNSQTYFDMDGDGFAEKTAWVQEGDGLLVLDRNANGTIDNGSELFGNFTPLQDGTAAKDAFEALMQYDENKDGVIDKNDSIYNSLKVWKDNGDDLTVYTPLDYTEKIIPKNLLHVSQINQMEEVA